MRKPWIVRIVAIMQSNFWMMVAITTIIWKPGFTGGTTDKGVGKRSHAGLSPLNDMDSSTKGFCAILSGNLVVYERRLSFTYGRPAES